MSPPLFASDSGGGDTALVLLHGFGGFHGLWDDVVSRLSGSVRIIAYDLPGHGGSLAVPGSRPSATARMIVANLGERGIGRANLAGHSMGGAIATLMALAEPGLVASLALLSPGGFGPEINGPLLRRFAEAVSRDEIRACLVAMSTPGFAVSDEILDALERMRAIAGQTESLTEIAATITRGDRQGEIPRASIAGLNMPVGILWGDADPVLPFAQAAGLPRSFKTVRAAGAGHMLIEERPEAVAALLASVMTGARPASR